MRPRPRITGNENPALIGVDRQSVSPFVTSQLNVVPKKMAEGSDEARRNTLMSARKQAARKMKGESNAG